MATPRLLMALLMLVGVARAAVPAVVNWAQCDAAARDLASPASGQSPSAATQLSACTASASAECCAAVRGYVGDGNATYPNCMCDQAFYQAVLTAASAQYPAFATIVQQTLVARLQACSATVTVNAVGNIGTCPSRPVPAVTGNTTPPMGGHDRPGNHTDRPMETLALANGSMVTCELDGAGRFVPRTRDGNHTAPHAPRGGRDPAA